MSKVKKSKKHSFQDESLCPIHDEEISNVDKLYTNKKNITKIVDEYVDDYDIIYVHNIVITALNQEKINIADLQTKLKNLKSVSETLQTYNAKKETFKKIQNITEQIDQINNYTKLTEYNKLAEPLIDQYKLLKGNVEERLVVIQKYLKLAKKYIVIHVTRKVNHKTECQNCHVTMEEIVNIEGVIRCIHCNNEYQIINATKYADNYNMQYINIENDDENFTKALMRYQGLQNNPPKILFTKLDNYFSQRGFPSAESIRALPCDDRGKKGNTNKKMLCLALSNIGYSTFYEDQQLIGHIYWDWTLPDLTDVKDIILEHYAITQKSFYKIPPNIRQRISSLGTQYRLWRHLQLVGEEVQMDDFKIAENNDSLQNHHRLWRMMCEISNNPDIYYID